MLDSEQLQDQRQNPCSGITFKCMPTRSKVTSYISDDRKASSLKTKDNFPKHPRPYVPMVTFAPERSRGTDSYLLRPNASRTLSRQEELPTTKQSQGLVVFRLISCQKKINVPKMLRPFTPLNQDFLAMTTCVIVIDLIAKLWRMWIELITIHSTVSTWSLTSEESAAKNSKPTPPHSSSRFILPKNFNRHPKEYSSKQPVVATSKP